MHYQFHLTEPSSLGFIVGFARAITRRRYFSRAVYYRRRVSRRLKLKMIMLEILVLVLAASQYRRSWHSRQSASIIRVSKSRCYRSFFIDFMTPAYRPSNALASNFAALKIIVFSMKPALFELLMTSLIGLPAQLSHDSVLFVLSISGLNIRISSPRNFAIFSWHIRRS